MPHAEPAQVFVLGISLRIEERFHPLIVQTTGLEQIDDGELVSRARLCVGHSEVEPLGVFHCEVVPT